MSLCRVFMFCHICFSRAFGKTDRAAVVPVFMDCHSMTMKVLPVTVAAVTDGDSADIAEVHCDYVFKSVRKHRMVSTG